MTAAKAARRPTRERILDEVERLIAVKGVYAFTLKEIAEPLKVQPPAIYKHYRSRDDVLVAVSRRFIALLAQQFRADAGAAPVPALRRALDAFVELKMAHPAYVRLSLIDFATPGGGMEYVKLAAGGSFGDNFRSGPLAPMHERLRRLLVAGARKGEFRSVDASDFYGIVKSALLIRLVFPDDDLLVRPPTVAEVAGTQAWLWDVALSYLSPRRAASNGKRRVAARSRVRASRAKRRT
ncbi:MAG: TetR/AcrR family transcriptional regulator [Proteobacteria bacterium]|nr:TetR/AcrR family transcriptional regulator [Pseudomonadota bacterium]